MVLHQTCGDPTLRQSDGSPATTPITDHAFMSSDQIAYLRDLANSYQSEGNFSAAVATWEQILAMDPTNVEAKQGVTLAQMQAQGLSPGSGPAQDADATMMFSVGDVPGFGAPAAPAGGFPASGGGGFDADRTMVFGAPGASPEPAGGQDADRTMVFGAPGFGPPPSAPAGGGFDADKTMVFGAPGFAMPEPPAPAPSGGGFDAERTMIFGASTPPSPFAPPAAPAPPFQAPTGFDADRTMAFNPSLAPPPSTPWAAPVEPPSSDMTMMSPPSANDYAAPPPSPFLEPPKHAGGRPLQDFSIPGAPPSFTPPPMPGGAGLPPPPSGGSGFSFELPPPPGKGGGMGLPDLPSVGLSSPPPMFTPAPPPPMPAPSAPKRTGGQFGEVDAGEIESLAVPTVSAPPVKGAEPPTAEREEELRQQYEKQYGRTPASPPKTTSRPSAPSRPAVSKKALGIIGLIVALVLAGGWFGIKLWMSRQESGFIPPVVEKDPNTGLSKEKAEALISQKLAEASKARLALKLDDAERLINEARDIALKNNIPIPGEIKLAGDEVQKEKQYQDAFSRAQRSFCVEDYPKANFALLDLEKARPDKPEAGKYIERIFWNLAVEKLQQKEPWEAVYYLENLVQRNPGDGEAKKLLDYAGKFQPGDDLNDAYLDVVDPLSTRMAGCQ